MHAGMQLSHDVLGSVSAKQTLQRGIRSAGVPAGHLSSSLPNGTSFVKQVPLFYVPKRGRLGMSVGHLLFSNPKRYTVAAFS